MAKPGVLTATGLLYEGNFEEWRRQTEEAFEVHFPNQCHNLFSPTRSGTPLELDSRLDPAQMIAARVAPSLLDRISEDEMTDVFRLVPRLHGLARPFRFLSLPPEVRNITYQFVIPHESIVLRFHGRRPGMRKYITQASRQLREETLPIFFANTSLTLKFFRRRVRGQSEMTIEYVMNQLQQWASHYVGSSAKYLRDVELFIRNHASTRPGSLSVRFYFSKQSGLRMTLLSPLSPYWQNEVQKYAAAIESTRTLLNLQGESIIMAIFSNPKLWDLA